jgi:SAM-dependent methyltransferase
MTVRTQPEPAALSPQQFVQEELYTFPYHHIPSWSDEHFCHFRVLPPAYEYAAYCRFVISWLTALPVSSILDVGCGDGKVCAELRRAFPGARITGIDISTRAIALARELVPGCEFVCGNVGDATLPRAGFDAATLIETLEHVEPNATAEFLLAIRDRLREGGRLLVTVPSRNCPLTSKHYRHFDEQLMRATLSPFFDIEQIMFLNRNIWWEPLLYRLMYNRFFILANRRLLFWLFRAYERAATQADAHNGMRVLAVCVKPRTSRRAQ